MTKASAGTRIIKSFLPVRLDKELGRKKKTRRASFPLCRQRTVPSGKQTTSRRLASSPDKKGEAKIVGRSSR